MARSLLQLEDCWITRLEFRTADGPEEPGETEDDERSPRLAWEVRKSPDEPSYLVALKISDKTARLHLLLDVSGTFSFNANVPLDTQSRMVDINGPTILYGIARGIVGGLTGFSPGRRYLMPSVNVIALAERRDKKRARTRATASAV